MHSWGGLPRETSCSVSAHPHTQAKPAPAARGSPQADSLRCLQEKKSPDWVCLVLWQGQSQSKQQLGGKECKNVVETSSYKVTRRTVSSPSILATDHMTQGQAGQRVPRVRARLMGKQLPLVSYWGPLSSVDLLLSPFPVLGMSWPANLGIRSQETGEHPASPWPSCHLQASLPAPTLIFRSPLNLISGPRQDDFMKWYLLSFSPNLLPDPVTMAPELSLRK